MEKVTSDTALSAEVAAFLIEGADSNAAKVAAGKKVEDLVGPFLGSISPLYSRVVIEDAGFPIEMDEDEAE